MGNPPSVYALSSARAPLRIMQARIQELEFLDAAVAAVSREAGVAGDGDGVGGHIEPSSTSAGGLRDQVCIRLFHQICRLD